MIGVNAICKCNQIDTLPNGRVTGHVTEHDQRINSTYDLVGAKVELFQDKKLIAFTSTFEGGKYAIDSVTIGTGYKLLIKNDSTFESEVFSIASGEIKVIDAKLITNKSPDKG